MTSKTNYVKDQCPGSDSHQPGPQSHRLCPTRFRVLLIAALTMPTLSTVFAQETPATSPKVEDETITLSPFIVNSSKDQGYRATSTLAGSRINTELKDVASSITVVTKEFFKDVAAVDINDVLTYTANTEGTHDFTSTQVGSRNSPGGYADNPASNPQGSNRIRGLFAANITRDYFYTIGSFLGFDTYNLDSVTINRGPNSVLAGLGSPAGIINYSPAMASLVKNTNEVSYRAGSFGDQRATFNSNVVALRDVLAIRIAAEWADKGFKQKPSYAHDKRLYTALTYQPWKKTTLRASFEVVKTDTHLPNNITAVDGVTPWLNAGKPSYDSTSSAPIASGLFGGGLAGPTTLINVNGTVGKTYSGLGLYNYYAPFPSAPGIYSTIGLSDNHYFDLATVNTSPTTGDNTGKTQMISIDQEILPNLFANVSYLHESLERNSAYDAPGMGGYTVDVNVYTPDGLKNPHYGETFMGLGGANSSFKDVQSNRVVRGTLTYDLDLNKYNKWFGRYRATGFVENRKTETQYQVFDAMDSDPGPTFLGHASINTLYYLGGTSANGYKSKSVVGPHNLFSQTPEIYVDPTTKAVTNQTFTDNYYLTQDQKKLVKLASSAVVLQSYLWQDRIVGMFGLRRDKDQESNTLVSVPADVDPISGLLKPLKPYGAPATSTVQTKTYGVVIHPLKWLSFHYNHGDNFTPSAGKIDLLGKPSPTPTGTGKDYGFSIRTPDDKLNLKVNWFDLVAANSDAGSQATHLAVWNMAFHEEFVGPELAAAAGIAYKRAMAPGITTGDQRLAYTSNTVSKGIEMELTYNPTKNWRIMASVSKQEAMQSDIAAGLTAFVEERLAYWKSTPGLWTGQVTSNNPWGIVQTGQQHFNQFELGDYIGYKSAEGKPSTQIAKWHASVISNYTFSDGTLKGLNFGGAGRYIEKSVIGNPAIVGDVNGTPTVTGLDLAHPYTAPAYIGVDAWVGYAMKIYKDKYILSFQLNGRDLQTGGGARPIVANSDGAHAVFRVVQPRTFYLTTKLEF